MNQTMIQSKEIKCVVWDLDNTLWNGILAEGDNLVLKDNAIDVVKTLDQRGILQSIASKNNHHDAIKKLEEYNLKEYFLFPQINWGSKANNINRISNLLNIGIDTFAFVDDQPFEREEVLFKYPQVFCIDAADIAKIPDMPRMLPRFMTDFTKNRRCMYLDDLKRKESEEVFEGPQEAFLSSLAMHFSVQLANHEDLERVEELMIRSNQLNATGYQYSLKELDSFRVSDDYLLLMAELSDKFGSYGKIGVALVKKNKSVWTLKLLLISCRVLTRGVGSILLNYILNLASNAGVQFLADFVQTERNRRMYITYKFSGFEELKSDGRYILLEHKLSRITPYPNYVTLNFP